MNLEHKLAGGFKAAFEARQMLAGLASHVPDDLLHTTTMLVNELVTNAVRHGMIGRGEEVTLAVDISGSRMRIEVRNPGSASEVKMRDPSLDEGSGWGLQIVETLSDRWGFEQDGGTTVWFELDLNGETGG
ncbi:MAG: ATP-binding protein [Actinomycetota bacterium]